MTIDVSLAPPEEILTLRDLYRKEMNCQIVRDSWHGRGWTDSYLLRLNERVVGYGLVVGLPGGFQPTDKSSQVLNTEAGKPWAASSWRFSSTSSN